MKQKTIFIIFKDLLVFRNILRPGPTILWLHVRNQLKTKTAVAPLLLDEMDKT